jgi:hypothetical protein
MANQPVLERIGTAPHRPVWCAAYVAIVMMTSLLEPPMSDIELPLRTRREDAAEASHRADAADPPGEASSEACPAMRAPLPFLVSRLICAEGPFGLDVEVKSRERVVGTWTIDVGPRHAGEPCVSRAQANLYMCASVRGDVRATGAFLVLRQWAVLVSNKEQLEFLYGALSVAVLERLDSLLGGVPNASGESRLCILFLVDGRRLKKKDFSLDRMQVRLLEDLESDHTIAGLDLRVAHGRGKGMKPHVVFTSTLAPMQDADSGLGLEADRVARAPLAARSLVGEVFVRETLSPANVRWGRRASDRLR